MQKKNAPVQRAADDETATPPKYPKGGFYIDVKYIGVIFLQSDKDEAIYNGERLYRWQDSVFTYYNDEAKEIVKCVRNPDGLDYTMMPLPLDEISEYELELIRSMESPLAAWGSSLEEAPWYAAFLRDMLLAPYSAGRTIFWDGKDIFGNARKGWDFWMSFLDLPGAGTAMKALGKGGSWLWRALRGGDKAEDAAKVLNASEKLADGADDLAKNADDLAKNADEAGEQGNKLGKEKDGNAPKEEMPQKEKDLDSKTGVPNTPIENLAAMGISVKPVGSRMLKFVGEMLSNNTNIVCKDGWLQGLIKVTDPGFKGGGIATNIFKTAMEHFPDVKGIKGVWLNSDEIKDNYDSFMKIYKATGDEQAAAFATATGKIAKKLGFTKVSVKVSEKLGDITAYFTQ